MKKFIVISILLLFCSAAKATEYQSPVSKNRENYFIGGNKEDQTKFQLSLKADLFYPFNTGFYLGYTQTTWWKVYDGADTMSSNYQPEVFYRLQSKNNLFNNANLRLIDFIQLGPYYHCSNGIEGEDHRGINTYYGQVQVSSGGRLSIGINFKGFGYYGVSRRNEDIKEYKGYYANDVFLKLNSADVEDMSLAEIHFKHGGTLSKRWYCVEAQTILFSSKIQPRLFCQYYNGYGENMLNYNIKDHSFYAGLIF